MDPEADGIVATAVLRDLEMMPEPIQRTTEAAIALAGARELDAGRVMSTAPVMKELRAIMDLLRTWASASAAEDDPVDDLAARRAARRGDVAG